MGENEQDKLLEDAGMKRFVAALSFKDNAQLYINTEADKLTVDNSILYAWLGSELVAVVDMGALVAGHLSEVTPEKAHERKR
jgi:hypothetical protein